MPKGYWKAHCPAHEDEHKSLSVLERNGKAILKCHKGCPEPKILQALGLDGEPQRYPARRKTTPGDYKETIYEIRDVSGNLVAKHIRRDFKDGSKTFLWGEPNGTFGLNGLRVEDLPLYGTELLKTFDKNKPVIITEGEKAAMALRQKGYQALATVTGAAAIPSPSVLEPLRGYQVLLWPDADEAGELHAFRLARRLRALGIQVFRINVPNDKPKGWDAADSDPDEMRTLIEGATPWDVPPEAIPFLSIPAPALVADESLRPPTPLIPGLIPQGFSLIASRPKVGKTYFCLQLALGLASGGWIFGKIKVPEAHPVYFLALEDGSARVRARLLQLSHIARPPELLEFAFAAEPLPQAVEKLASWARAHPGAVFFIDTLSRILPPVKTNNDAYRASYDAIALLSDFCRAYNASIVCSFHTRKSGFDPSDPLSAVVGGTGYVAVPDAILVLYQPAGRNFTELHCICRDWPPAVYALRLEEGTGWVWLGKAAEVHMTGLKKSIIEGIQHLGGRASPAQIADLLGIPKGSAKAALWRLTRCGILRNEGGVYILGEAGEESRPPEGSENIHL